MTDTQRRKERRQRRLFAAIAGWALLGAASAGIVACSNADAAETAAAGASATSGNATGQSTAAGSSSTAGSTTAATSSTATSALTAASSAAAPSAEQASTYTDGSYTATGSYSSPGGTESISITLTLAGDTITDATATGEATSGPSEEYQSEFVSNFAALIVGKDIDSVSLDKVAGSSLTSSGFNAAVETIKSDALA